MQYNRLGQSGLRVSALGLGTWNTLGVTVDGVQARRILCAARDAGINFLDTADTYAQGAAESMLGDFLAECGRDEFVVATKHFFPTSADANGRGLSRKHIFCSVHQSLRRLRTDYIDLLQCHRFDPDTPLDETVRAMDDLIRQGKVLYWGLSRFDDVQVQRCADVAETLAAHRPISNQWFYNLLERRIEPAIVPACQSLGVGVIAYSPLAQGMLSGKYAGGSVVESARAAAPAMRKEMWQLTPDNEAAVRRLQGVAASHGVALARVALAWCLQQPGVASVLTGATSPDQVHQNAEAADLRLSAELAAEIDGAVFDLHPSPRGAVGHCASQALV